MKTEEKSWARRSFLLSLIVHGMIFVFLGLYVVGSSTRVQELVHALFVPESKPQKYEPRPQPIRPVTRPLPPQTRLDDSDIVPINVPERESPMPYRAAETNVLLRAAGEPPVQNVASPSDLAKNRIAPSVTTAAKVLPSDISISPSVSGGAAGQALVSSPAGIGKDGMGAGERGRSQTGSGLINAATGRKTLSMTRDHTAMKVQDGMSEVAQGVTLGRERVPPLPKGEPGGIVMGRGKEIEGRIRFARIKHYLADWWSDPTSMPAVLYWMNTQTNVKSDMNIAGGSVVLEDPKLLKCPLAIMTGHDRTILTSNIKGNYRHTLTPEERAGLRNYLIDAGGLLFFDECGHDVMLARLLKNELRGIFPEHEVEWIPNTHDLYYSFYDLGGPPPGAYAFWKHSPRKGQTIVGKYLQGLFIDDELAAIISDRDYLCAARTKSRPGHAYTGEEGPSTYRFMTNVLIYSLTHGRVSDHSSYIPELVDRNKISIDVPVKVPEIVPE